MGMTDVLPLAEAERQYLLRVLEHVGGNKTQAARVLGIGRATLYRLLDGKGHRSPLPDGHGSGST